jgi:hypothetical protein
VEKQLDMGQLDALMKSLVDINVELDKSELRQTSILTHPQDSGVSLEMEEKISSLLKMRKYKVERSIADVLN